MDAAAARDLFRAAPVARLATADMHGQPHVVPVVFAVVGDTIYSAVDEKPKRSRELRRLANVVANPRVALLVDHYEPDWRRLWWVRADGAARIIDVYELEAGVAIAHLVRRYSQYAAGPPVGPVLAVDVDRWSGWRSQP